MKNKFNIKFFLITALLISNQAMAQMIDIGESINKQGNSFIATFGTIAIIILIAILIWSAEHFTSKNGDWKKAFVIIAAYIVLLGIVLAIATALRGISI